MRTVGPQRDTSVTWPHSCWWPSPLHTFTSVRSSYIHHQDESLNFIYAISRSKIISTLGSCILTGTRSVDPRIIIMFIFWHRLYNARRTKRKGQLTKRSYTEEVLAAAISDVRAGKLGTRRAAAIYGVPRSTLRNKVFRNNPNRRAGASATTSSQGQGRGQATPLSSKRGTSSATEKQQPARPPSTWDLMLDEVSLQCFNQSLLIINKTYNTEFLSFSFRKWIQISS